jgi:FAD/FMN-containing dehydrogenase
MALASTHPALVHPAPLAPTDLDGFRATFRGRVIEPGDVAYDEARQVQNAVFDRHPALVVQPIDADDVAVAVRYARAAGLPIAVRSGGHSLAGHSTADGAIVIDLAAMKGIHIDPEARMAWAQPGLTAGEYTIAAAAHGLATPFGDTASVGLGGITLGGGIGWLVRKHGLTIDSLVSAELVTADGEQVLASATVRPELFWAIRGGGGNFGIVTRFQFLLHPVDTVLGGVLVLPATRDVLRSLVPLAASAPEDLSTISFLMHAPPLPFIPAEQHGQLALFVMLVHAGDLAAGEAAVAGFRQVAAPIADMVGPMPYPAIYQLTTEGENRGPGAHRSLFLDTLDDAAVDAILERASHPSSPFAITQVRVLGGAMARVPADATAFAHRGASVLVTLITPFHDPAELEQHEAWTQAYYEALAPGATGVYSNFLEDEGEARIHEAYPGATYERLAEVKRHYDPDNVFRLNQNIRPAS